MITLSGMIAVHVRVIVQQTCEKFQPISCVETPLSTDRVFLNVLSPTITSKKQPHISADTTDTNISKKRIIYSGLKREYR